MNDLINYQINLEMHTGINHLRFSVFRNEHGDLVMFGEGVVKKKRTIK